MPIPVSEIAQQLRFALDAEGSDHYRDDLDIIPAINAAVKWLENVVTISYGEKKIGEEIFQDLTTTGIFRTSIDSRVSVDVFPAPLWGVLAVYIDVTTGDTGQAAPALPSNDRLSQYRPDLYFVSANYDAKRLSIEKWIVNKDNPFEAGYEGSAVCLPDYAYLNPVTHTHTGTINVRREIEIRPVVSNDFVAIAWTRQPTPATLITDSIDFPHQAFQMIFNKALQYIAYKQGDQTNLYAVTLDDIRTLITAFR
jgi:hypothetical protein